MEIKYIESRIEEEILLSDWLDEFEIVDGLNQHKLGLTFKEWLHSKGYRR